MVEQHTFGILKRAELMRHNTAFIPSCMHHLHDVNMSTHTEYPSASLVDRVAYRYDYNRDVSRRAVDEDMIPTPVDAILQKEKETADLKEMVIKIFIRAADWVV